MFWEGFWLSFILVYGVIKAMVVVSLVSIYCIRRSLY